jgi:hypothetical protein
MKLKKTKFATALATVLRGRGIDDVLTPVEHEKIEELVEDWKNDAEYLEYSQRRPLRHAGGKLTTAVGIFEREIEMTRNMSVVLSVVVLIAVVVGVDLLFFRHRFWERLIANIGIVMVFAAFYLRFLKNP